MKLLTQIIGCAALTLGSAHATTTLIGGSIGNGNFEAALPDGSDNSSIDYSGHWYYNSTSGDAADGQIKAQTWARSEGSAGLWLKAYKANTASSFGQEFAATEGSTYTLSADFKATSTVIADGASLDMSIIWLDIDGEVMYAETLSLSDSYTSSNELWETFELTATAPEGVSDVQIEFDFATKDGSSGGGFMLDDVNFTVIPEPSGVSLLGLSGICLLLRRRRC